MQHDTILFLIVEQSSDIELIYIHTKIATTKQISLIYGCISARQLNYIT